VVGFFDTYRYLYPVSREVLRGTADKFQVWVKEQPDRSMPGSSRRHSQSAKAGADHDRERRQENNRRSQTAGSSKTTSMSTTSAGPHIRARVPLSSVLGPAVPQPPLLAR
jgi:hypothetical protein